MADGFVQDPPRLENQFDDDSFLREYLERVLPAEARSVVVPELRQLGGLSVELYAAQLADRDNYPVLTQWDAWGNRIDHIELTPLWRRAREIACERGLVAIAYERSLGELSRIHQFAANYLVQASLDFYSCPLAMTDGAARTLLEHASPDIIARAVPRLTSRDSILAWTSGQWMTERSGGSDVGLSETVARRDGTAWRLFGTKWFTSAITSEMALTLARPEGNPTGSRGLALFYLETRDSEGKLNGIAVNRLKDKLGTRKVPTAELTLDGALAEPLCGLDHGVRSITPMLTVTRVWNAAGACWLTRRALALARDYATRRSQFGTLLASKPLHVQTLAGLEAEARGQFLLAFRAIEALGKCEAATASESEALLLRVLTPLAKLVTAKQAVSIVSEAIECFGGAGYVEDTGLPGILRDAQVLPIWEGTTNVLSLDLLRALSDEPARTALESEIVRRASSARELSLVRCAELALDATRRAFEWLASSADRDSREGGARGLALTLGRALELALLVDHAQWATDRGRAASAAAARRLAHHGVDRLVASDELSDARALYEDETP